MSLQYKNIEKIVSAKNGITAERLPNIKNSLSVSYVFDPVNSELTSNNSNSIVKEFHVYSGKSWITGNHETNNNYWNLVTKSITNGNLTDTQNYLEFNVYKQFEDLKLTAGNYRVVFNFFKNLIGSYRDQYLVIDEISPDRTEVKLRAIDIKNQMFLTELVNYVNTVSTKQTLTQTGNVNNTYKSYVLNFNRNQCFTFINSVVIGGFLYFKLLDPLPDNILIDFKCWVAQEMRQPYIDHINILPASIVKTVSQFSSPNFEAVVSKNVSADVGYKNWSDLLSASIPTSQQIVDSYFSGSLSGMQLNIDFRDFNNFIFYSSAAERLANFKYKIQLLEQYTAQSSSIASITTTTVATTNALDIQTKQNNLIGGFDSFEKYLYYTTSSKLTTHDNPLEFPTVPDITGSYVFPVPKISGKNYSITSSQFNVWYNDLFDKALQYDTKNYNALRNTIPIHVQDSDNGLNIQLFADMLGHHFDILYTYINHMSKIHKRDENPKTGMPNELLYSVAQQFGWNLTDGRQTEDLWKYVFGVNSTGAAMTGSNSVLNESIGGKDLTYATWRRIVNNLPLLLKTKGTKRSIYALMSCYGIPKSIISINEYGGPRGDGRIPIHERAVSSHALDLISNTAGSASINVKQQINSVELRVKTDDIATNPVLPSTMTLYTIGDNVVTLDYVSGNVGNIQINGTGSGNIELFDGGWLNTVLRTVDNKLEIVAKKSKFGKIVSEVSAFATASFTPNSTLKLGVAVSGSRLQGQLQELRFWTSSLNNDAFNNHVNAPKAYNGNTDAHNELVFRLPLSEKINHATTSSLQGIQWMNSGISASFGGWTNSAPYDLIEETHYNQSVSLGGSIYDDNKVRFESSTLPDSTLDSAALKSVSEYDEVGEDRNRLGVYFSPQTMIDEDIMNYFGYIDLNDYVGDPGPTEKRSYPRLIQRAKDFYKNYTNRTDINEFMKLFSWFDSSFFQQLEQLLPARADKVTGVLIHPTLLERNKDTVLNDVVAVDYTIVNNLAIIPGVDIRDIGRDSEIININNSASFAIAKPKTSKSSINNNIQQSNKLQLVTDVSANNNPVNSLVTLSLRKQIDFSNSELNTNNTSIVVLTDAIKRNGSNYKYTQSINGVPDWAYEPILLFIEPVSILKSFKTIKNIGTKLSSNGINQPNANGVIPIQVNIITGNQLNV